MPSKRTSKRRPTNLIFWGKNGDSAAAAIFVTELRSAGLPVKIVGLGGTRAKGTNGLTIEADMILSQAHPLASLATYIILPFTGSTLRNFTVDPWLKQLFDDAHEHGVIFIQSEQLAASLDLTALFDREGTYNSLYYPSGEALFEFIRGLEWPSK